MAKNRVKDDEESLSGYEEAAAEEIQRAGSHLSMALWFIKKAGNVKAAEIAFYGAVNAIKQTAAAKKREAKIAADLFSSVED